MSKDANDNMGKPQRVDIDTNRNLVYIARALRYAALALGFVALDAFAACSRERGVELFRMFEREAMTTRPYCVTEDWAMPGCQSYDFFGPPECKRR